MMPVEAVSGREETREQLVAYYSSCDTYIKKEVAFL